MRNGVPKELSTKLVDYVGGRFIYLVSIITLYHLYNNVNPNMEDQQLYKRLLGDKFSRKLAGLLRFSYPRSRRPLTMDNFRY